MKHLGETKPISILDKYTNYKLAYYRMRYKKRKKKKKYGIHLQMYGLRIILI